MGVGILGLRPTTWYVYKWADPGGGGGLGGQAPLPFGRPSNLKKRGIITSRNTPRFST